MQSKSKKRRASTNAKKANSKKLQNKIDEKIELQENITDNNTETHKFDLKSTMNEYLKFYKENIRKKQVIFFIITLILFGFSMYSYISNLNNDDFLQQIQNISENTENVNMFKTVFINKILIALVLIVAGVTPYLYISSLGVLVGHTISVEIANVLSVATHEQNILLMTMGAIIQIIGFSLASANGIFWCNITGKRNKYENSKNKSFLDIKKEIYMLKGDKEKLKQLEKKRKEKIKSNEKYNIKVPYKMFVISFIISTILVSIGTIIFYI